MREYADMRLKFALHYRCIIGVNPWERERKQNVNMDIIFYADCGGAGVSDLLEETIDYRYEYEGKKHCSFVDRCS